MATYKIELRRDVAADWTSNNPTLALGEVGLETDTSKWKAGDGTTAWTSLAYYDGNIKATKLDDLTAPDDNTDLNVSTSKHGLFPKLPASTGLFLKDDMTWDTPAGGDTPKLDDCAAPDDNTDLNASTSKHGLVLKATAPAANLLNVVGIANGETVYTNKAIFDATDPAALGTAGPGTAVTAAHRDHIHALPTLLPLVAALGSDHTWAGITAVMTAGASLTIGQAVYVGSADSKMELADADQVTTMPCIALATGTIAENATGIFLLDGFFRDDTWAWTVGGFIYISPTSGALTQTAPSGAGDQVQIVGVAITADIIRFYPNYVLVEI